MHGCPSSESRTMEPEPSKLLYDELTSKLTGGCDITEVLGTVRTLNDRGAAVTLDFLGEEIEDLSGARAYRQTATSMIHAIEASRVDADIALKPSALGLRIDPICCEDSLRSIVAHAHALGIGVWFDAERAADRDIISKIVCALCCKYGADTVGLAHQVRNVGSAQRLDALIERRWPRFWGALHGFHRPNMRTRRAPKQQNPAPGPVRDPLLGEYGPCRRLALQPTRRYSQ